MEKEYPLYPELSEEGKEEAQKLIDSFKVAMAKVAEDALATLYTDVACYIESDSWSNYRNQMMQGFRNYDNRKVQGAHDFKEVRQSILKEFREELIADLNQDLLAEIAELKQTIQILQESRRLY